MIYSLLYPESVQLGSGEYGERVGKGVLAQTVRVESILSWLYVAKQLLLPPCVFGSQVMSIESDIHVG